MAALTKSVDPLLREALEQITSRYRGAHVEQQIEKVVRLRQRYPHSITVLHLVKHARPGHGQFNCFMHALELSSPPPLFVEILKSFAWVYPGAEFIHRLIQRQLLEGISVPDEGAVLVYSLDGMPKHAGKFEGGMVVSKWGLGHMWQHQSWEVPASYGDTVDAFRRVDNETAAAWFVEYAKDQVGADTIDSLEQGLAGPNPDG